jgi:hypothetical protein
MPAGRPTDYRPEFAEQAKILCEAGATDADLADEFGVTVQTLRNWRRNHPAFFAAIKLNKPIADAEVERSLYERATGYTRESVKIFCGKDGEVTQVKFLEHVPPDPTAMIFWLKNRQPDIWRDRRETEVTGKDGGPVEFVTKSILERE